MPYPLTEFTDCLPTAVYYADLDESDMALHAATWAPNHFQSLASLVRFAYRYSCVLQPYIANPGRADLDEWFFADDAADERAEQALGRNPIAALDAAAWLEEHYPTVSIRWLVSGAFDKALILGGEYPEFYAWGLRGSCHVFAADSV